MEKEDKEKIILTAKEILLTFCDVAVKLEEIFGYSWHRAKAREYWKWRELDQKRFYQSLWRLKKQGYIKKYQQEKKNLIKLTPLGNSKALRYLAEDFTIKIPKSWDKKWRLVIFDIPKDKKALRDIVRNRLIRLGFCQLQKSVFVYPYDCQEVIQNLKYIYNLGPYLQYIVAESIETELDLVDHFLNQNILNTKK